MMDDEKMTWRQAFVEAREEGGDDSPVVAVAPGEAALDVEFYGGYGATKGPSFTIWTEQRVYFPACYDGAEWIESVPRNPVA